MNNRSVLRHTFGTLAASVLSLLLLNLSSVLLVRMLGIEGRGEVAAAILVPTIIAYGGWIGLPTATGYLVAVAPAQRFQTIATARFLALLLAILLSIVSLLLSALYPIQDSVRTASMLFTLFIPLNMYRFLHEAVLQADLRTVSLNAIRISGALFYVSALSVLWLLGAATLTSVILAQIGTTMVGFVLFSMVTASRPWFGYDSQIARALLGYGSRAHLGSLSPVDNLRIDQLILGIFLSTYDLGTYVIAMTFALANRTIGSSVGLIAFPLTGKIFATRNSSRFQQLYGLIVATGLLSIAAGAVEIGFGKQLLSLLFDVQSNETYYVMVILVIGSMFTSVSQVSSSILRGLSRPGTASLSELVSAGTLFVYSLLLWEYKIKGVAAAVTMSALSTFLYLLLSLVRATRSAERKWDGELK